MDNDLTCHLTSSFVHHIPCLDYCGSCFNLSCYAFVFCSAASHPFFLDCLLLSLSWWHVYLLLFLYGFVMATSFGSQGLMVNVMVEIIGLLGWRRFVNYLYPLSVFLSVHTNIHRCAWGVNGLSCTTTVICQGGHGNMVFCMLVWTFVFNFLLVVIFPLNKFSANDSILLGKLVLYSVIG